MRHLVVTLALLGACAAEQPENSRRQAPVAAPPASNPLATAQAPAQAESNFVGVVRERLPAGSYAYLAVDDAGTRRWVATMGAGAPSGTQVQVRAYAVADDFHSRRLDRRFDRVVFGAVEPVASTHHESK